MAAPEKARSTEDVPVDLLPILRRANILTEKQFEDVRRRVLEGQFPLGSKELAAALIRERLLTDYQARRLLSNKPQGLVVGRYVIMDRIGSGSMGRVYKAHHQLMDRVVALKIIAPEIVTNTKIVSRFQREMKLVGRLDHPNVVRAFDADQIGPTLYIVMEYVNGQSLGQKFRAEGTLAPLDVANYGAQAARGLAHAHEQAVVHRDVKPSNLLLGENGQIKVLDLGLGVLLEADEQSTFATADGIAVGTIDYMSPEQACGKDVDGRSDIYSLGCAMYHLISGRLPFPGSSPVERLGKRLSGRPTPILEARPDVPLGLVQVLERMMATKPHERYATASDAAEALESLIRPRGHGSSRKTAKTTEAPVPAAPPPAPKIVTLRPKYPSWFRPLASLAETAPGLALVTVVGLLVLFFCIGLAVGRLAL